MLNTIQHISFNIMCFIANTSSSFFLNGKHQKLISTETKTHTHTVKNFRKYVTIQKKTIKQSTTTISDWQTVYYGNVNTLHPIANKLSTFTLFHRYPNLSTAGTKAKEVRLLSLPHMQTAPRQQQQFSNCFVDKSKLRRKQSTISQRLTFE